MTYCDAHFHIVQSNGYVPAAEGNRFFACTCAHSPEEFAAQQLLVEEGRNATIVSSFGIHPQRCTERPLPPVDECAAFLETLITGRKICAIGEAGFDFFTSEYAAQKTWQEEAWRVQCELAVQYQLPLVVHNRKALDAMFRDSALLSRTKAVLFHSFAFGPREALSLLDHHMNAYFSFGKQILNGNKKSIACVKELPLERLLLETDAPFQALKGERTTRPEEIVRVYKAAAEIRCVDESGLGAPLEKNFLAVFGQAQQPSR